MNSNHSSFLKMIGLENEETAARDETVAGVEEREEAAAADLDVEAAQEISATEALNETAPTEDSQQTQSETEWDSERLEEPEATEPDSPQRQSQFTQTREFESRKTSLSKVSMLSRLSRIVSRVSRVSRADAIDMENAQTHIRENPDSTLAEDSLNTSSLEEVSALDHNSEINALMNSEIQTIDGAQISNDSSDTAAAETRNTLPFDYENMKPAESESELESDRVTGSAASVNRTAHFDYDEASGVARFVVLEGSVSSKAFYLGQLPLRIGRDSLNEIVIDDANVSRYHAEIRDQNGRPTIVDIGSTNGIKVNGAVISEAALKSHDIVQIGDALFEFLDPGVLSRGVLQVAAVEASAGQPQKKSRKKIYLALIVILGAGFYMLSSNRQQINNQVSERSRQLIAAKMESEVSDLKTAIEKSGGKPIAETPADDVKKAFLEKVEQSSLISLLPAELRQRMASVPAEILKIFVEDPKLLPAIVSGGAGMGVIQSALRSKLNELVEAARFSEALAIVTFLSANNPTDEKLKKWKSQLEERVGTDSQESGDSQTKTEEILKAYENNFENLIERGRIKEALEFAKRVRANAVESITKFPQFADRAKAEAVAWGERVEKAEALYADYKKALIANEESDREADELFQEVNSELDFANVTQARKLIDEFLKKYPNHLKVGEVVRLKKQLEGQLSGAFTSTKMSIETLIKAESYENAWTEIYRFLDQMPDHQQALELRMNLDKQTAPRATQYYNQARVFEFEADDLVAAEQYYKKTLEVTDPRGELYKKAQRRYADVKRKSIR